MTQEGWADRYTQTVAKELRRHRERRGLSARQLADACAKLGAPIQRSVIANLENGRRSSIGVAEILVFAAVLNIPPSALMAPVGYEKEVEALPGRMEDPYEFTYWVLGLAHLDEASVEEFKDNPIVRFEDLLLELSDVTDLREKVQTLEEITEANRDKHEAAKAAVEVLSDEFDKLAAASDKALTEDIEEAHEILDAMKSVNAKLKEKSAEVAEISQPFHNLEFYRGELAEAEAAARRGIGRIRENGWLPPKLPDDLAYLLEEPERPRKSGSARKRSGRNVGQSASEG